MVRVTEAAAVAASKMIGRGDERAADQAAVEGMRDALNQLDFDGTVVIGEGERDEAPMLYIGEKVGAAQGTGPKIDIALDPLEGTTITAKAGNNAMASSPSPRKGGCSTPPTSIWKSSPSARLSRGHHRSSQGRERERARRRASQGRRPVRVIVCVLDRPRHADLIAELRALGCGIQLIPDGDVAGVIAVTDPDTTIDLYMGSGGAPEGVLAAAALRCVAPVPGQAPLQERRRARPRRALGSRGSRPHLRPRGPRSGRRHLRSDRSDRRHAPQGSEAPQGLRQHRKRRHARFDRHGALGARRAPPRAGIALSGDVLGAAMQGAPSPPAGRGLG
jgi:fructose-1,6-bisphosphatase/sedoheptulose 1,7-bisphosphatase-like protein